MLRLFIYIICSLIGYINEKITPLPSFIFYPAMAIGLYLFFAWIIKAIREGFNFRDFIFTACLMISAFDAFLLWQNKPSLSLWLVLPAAAIAIYLSLKFVNQSRNIRKEAAAQKEADSRYEAQMLQTFTAANLDNEKGLLVGYHAKIKDKEQVLTADLKPLRYDGDRHIITFGPTGSGKGATAQIPALLDFHGSAFVIDVKGQLAAVTGPARQQWGQKVYAINPFDVLGIQTATYNPLRYLDPASLSFASDCKRIAEGLGFDGAESSKDKNAFFDITALDLVNLLIQWAVIYAGQGRFDDYEKNLISVRKVLNLGEEERKTFFKALTGCDNAPIAEGAQIFCSDRGAIADCFSTAQGKLAFLRDAGIERVLKGGGKNELSFADLKKQEITVYLIIPPELLNTHGRFLRLVVMSALSELMKEQAKPKEPVLMMLDEFAQLGPMPLIENAASVVRDYKIRLWLILQNLPQLQTLYGNRWKSFLSSAGITQFFAPNDLETAKYISDRSGTHTVIKKSEGFTSGTSGANASSGHSVNYHEVIEPNLTVQSAIDTHNQWQFLFAPNISDYIGASRFPYFFEIFPTFNKLAAPDPYHLTTEEKAALVENFRKNGFNPINQPQNITPAIQDSPRPTVSEDRKRRFELAKKRFEKKEKERSFFARLFN